MTTATTTARPGSRTESAIQIGILLLIGTMAGAASFTHVHDWTMANSPTGTGDWFGWANAVISELTPTAAGLEIRRRKRTHQSTRYPMAVLIAAAIVSIAAQVAQAKPGPTGYLLSALPALAFLALSKLVLSRAPVADTGTTVMDVPIVHVTTDRPALQDHHTDPAPVAERAGSAPAELSSDLLFEARMAVNALDDPAALTPSALAARLGIGEHTAAQLLTHLGIPVMTKKVSA
jgi:hypothetical protein